VAKKILVDLVALWNARFFNRQYLNHQLCVCVCVHVSVYWQQIICHSCPFVLVWKTCVVVTKFTAPDFFAPWGLLITFAYSDASVFVTEIVCFDEIKIMWPILYFFLDRDVRFDQLYALLDHYSKKNIHLSHVNWILINQFRFAIVSLFLLQGRSSIGCTTHIIVIEKHMMQSVFFLYCFFDINYLYVCRAHGRHCCWTKLLIGVVW